MQNLPSLYIHLPFCKRKCNYCDFVSYAGKEELVERYVEGLIRELQSSPLPPLLQTLYFGGGTPTLLESKHFEKILCSIPYSLCSEITIEANPGTADKTKLKELRRIGINRLSLGAQSFNDRHLQTLGRIHDTESIFQTCEAARATGFLNINLDLIFALPHQTFDEWKKDLNTALSLHPEHLSIYNLQIEENTPFYFQNLRRPDEETELMMYEYAIETLQANGYVHYEISNFAKAGFECRHNINYWKNGNYLGIGAGAHSHINGKRWANPHCIEGYLRHKPNPLTNDSPSETDQRETIFMGLRLLEGLPAEKFHGFEKEVKELMEDGLLMRENEHIKLTRRGLYLANLVFEKFI